MTKDTFAHFTKTLSVGDHIRIVYKAAPFNPMTGQPNAVGGAFVEAVDGALVYDDVSGDGASIRLCVDCEDLVTILVIGKVTVMPAGRLS